MANKNNKKNTNNSKKIKQHLSKISSTVKILCCFLFIFGICVGIFTTYFITKNDVFEIIGNTEIILNVGDDYVEQGVKIIAFGKDISDQVKIKGTVNTLIADDYVIEYSVDNFRFRNYILYKKITVKEV